MDNIMTEQDPGAQPPEIPDTEPLLTPAEVAAILRVDTRTVGGWARSGRLASMRTPGGHRRYPESIVRALFAELAEGVSA